MTYETYKEVMLSLWRIDHSTKGIVNEIQKVVDQDLPLEQLNALVKIHETQVRRYDGVERKAEGLRSPFANKKGSSYQKRKPIWMDRKKKLLNKISSRASYHDRMNSVYILSGIIRKWKEEFGNSTEKK